MSLQEKLNAQKERSKERMPADKREIIGKAIEELRSSGIVEKALQIGAKAPDFTMKNQDGVDISLAALLAKGPLVLSIYRGKW